MRKGNQRENGYVLAEHHQVVLVVGAEEFAVTVYQNGGVVGHEVGQRVLTGIGQISDPIDAHDHGGAEYFDQLG